MKPWEISIISGAAGGMSREALVYLKIRTKADTVHEVLELVEAAPDLLEACEEAYQHITVFNPAWIKLARQLEQAIKKAKGG